MTRIICGLVILALASGLAAQNGGRALAIEDYYRVKTIGAVSLSPDGRRVAFTVTSRTEANNTDSSVVMLVPASGGEPLRLSAPGIQATQPRWTPEGRLRFNGGGSVWEYNPDAPGPLAPPVKLQPADPPSGGTRIVSPDGQWVAVVRATPPAARAPSVLTDFERRHEARFKGRRFDWLDFQRDGAAYPVPNTADPYVTPAQEIFLARTGSGEETQLTRLGLRPQNVQWSPDGAALLFTADSTYRDERKYEHNQVWIVSRDGAVRRLTPDLDNDYGGASWSPDGASVLYTREYSTDLVIAKRMDNGGPTDLVIAPATGNGPERVLTAAWDYLPTAARFSPDGKHVYFMGGVGGTIHLFRVPAAGGAVEQVTTGQRRIGGVSFDKAMRRMAYTVGTMEAPADLWISDIDGKNERRLTRLHEDFTREIALDAAERVTFTSKDGTPVEGWLWKPHGYRREAGPYPLIVFSHGGPHSATGYGFDFKLQYFAANGYFVLATNFRGSTGYGEKFLWGSWGGWGNRDGEDVMAGVDHVIGRYPIDATRVGTVGHSYGGFMSNWLIARYPERFAAAAVGAGIVNWISDYGTADIARTKETEFFGTPWDSTAAALMMRQSPLTYAGKVKAATLFIHGELDERVPYSEAEQMYVALKKNGVPARMIQYEGQYHGITGSWNNVHRMLNELRWFNTYLRPAVRPQP